MPSKAKKSGQKTRAAQGEAALAALEKMRDQIPWAFAENGEFKPEEVIAELRGMNFASADRGARYRFDWAGSQNASAALRLPPVAALAPRRDLSRNFDDTRNIFIRGDNLESLKILRPAYAGRVKMIYIDPPYNTGNDFVYNDNFRDPLAQYLRETGQADEEGNATRAAARKEERKVNGRKHSNWMSMMLPRLFIAREFLSKDGVIFVSIDDNEVHHLRMLMNIVFGETRVDAFVWRKTSDDRYGKMRNVSTFRKDHEYVLVGFKDKESFNKLHDFPDFRNEYSNRDKDTRGPWESGSISRTEAASDTLHENYYSVTSPQGGTCTRQFDFPEDEFLEKVADNRIVWPKEGHGVPREKIFINAKRYVTPFSLLLNMGSTYSGTKELKRIFAGEEIGAEDVRPKPSRLIRALTQLSTERDSIVMDFFAGSATTAHAVMQLNAEDKGSRQCILVQLPEPTPEKSEARKAGYSDVAAIARARLLKCGEEIQKIKNGDKVDTGFRVYEMTQSAFRPWRGTAEETMESWREEQGLALESLPQKADEESLLVEVMLEEGYPLTSKVEQVKAGRNKVWQVSHPDLAEEGKVLHVFFGKKSPDDLAFQLGLKPGARLVVRDKSLTDTAAMTQGTQTSLRAI